MIIRPKQKCINLACELGGTPDTGDTARFWTVADEEVGAVNTGVARSFTTIAGGAAADFTIADTANDGLSVKPTRPGLYLCSISLSNIITAEASKMGISLDGADLTNAFLHTTAGMRTYVLFDTAATGGPAGEERSCVIPISRATIDNPATGFIRPMHDLLTGEFQCYFQIQRIGNFGG